MDFSTVKCRLCLYEYGHFNSIFQGTANTRLDRATKISMCTYRKVEIGDGLPDVICDFCLSFVENWDAFRLKCETASVLFLEQQAGKVYKSTDNEQAPTNVPHEIDANLMNCSFGAAVTQESVDNPSVGLNLNESQKSNDKTIQFESCTNICTITDTENQNEDSIDLETMPLPSEQPLAVKPNKERISAVSHGNGVKKYVATSCSRLIPDSKRQMPVNEEDVYFQSSLNILTEAEHDLNVPDCRIIEPSDLYKNSFDIVNDIDVQNDLIQEKQLNGHCKSTQTDFNDVIPYYKIATINRIEDKLSYETSRSTERRERFSFRDRNEIESSDVINSNNQLSTCVTAFRTPVEETRFYCEVCRLFFITAKHHLSYTAGKRICFKCGMTFRNTIMLKFHIKRTHTKYTCYRCHYTFATFIAMKEHIRVNHSGSQVTVRFGNSTTKSKTMVNFTVGTSIRPVNNLHNVELYNDQDLENNVNYMQPISDYHEALRNENFTNVRTSVDTDVEMTHHPPETVDRNECVLDNNERGSNVYDEYNPQIVDQTTKICRKRKLFYCSICRRNFKNIKVHEIYISKQSDKIDFTKTCFVCDVVFFTRKKLETHQQFYNHVLFPCRFCHQTFKTKITLMKHINKHKKKVTANNSLSATKQIETIENIPVGRIVEPVKSLLSINCEPPNNNGTAHNHNYYEPPSNYTSLQEENVSVINVDSSENDDIVIVEVIPSTSDTVDKTDEQSHANSHERKVQNDLYGEKNCQNDAETANTSPVKTLLHCTICNINFKNNNAHQSFIASNPKKADCSKTCIECSASFRTKQELKTHRSTHKNKRFACKYCHKIYSKKALWRYHMQIHKKVKELKSLIATRTSSQTQKMPEVIAGTSVRPDIDNKVQEINDQNMEDNINYQQKMYNNSVQDVNLNRDGTENVDSNSTEMIPLSCDNVVDKSGHDECNIEVENDVHNASCSHQNGTETASVNLENTSFYCEICKKKFVSNDEHQANIMNNSVDCSKTCIECWLCFSTKQELTAHRSTHKNKKFPCGHCHKIFSKKALWRKHIQIHKEVKELNSIATITSSQTKVIADVIVGTNVRPDMDDKVQEINDQNMEDNINFQQKMCNNSVQDVNLNRDRIENVDSNSTEMIPLSCENVLDKSGHDECNIEVENDAPNASCSHQSGTEMASVNLENTSFYCEICKKKFVSNDEHQANIMNNSVDCSKTCIECWLCFRTKREFKTHRSTHKNKKFPCGHCHKIFSKKALWRKHIQIHKEGNGGKKSVKKKKKKNVLATPEIEIVYDKKRDYVPIYIPVVDISSDDEERDTGRIGKIGRREDTVEPVTENAEITDSLFQNDKNLTDTKTSQASHPELDYTPNSSLNYWCRCSICGVDLKMRNIKIHLLMHATFNKNRCVVCKKCFRDTFSLEQHLVHHFTVRPHFCFQCFESFKNHTQLSVHMVSHGGEFKFLCQVCSEKFATKFLMEKHVYTHHRV